MVPAAPAQEERDGERAAGEDRMLVAALRRGEPAAFDRAYARHRARIHAFLVRLAGRRDLADDLFQETFLRLARHALRLDEDTDLRAWLYTVARNLYFNYRRFLLVDGDRLRALRLQPAPAPAATPESEAAFAQTAVRLEAALASIAPHHREVLLLVGVEGLARDTAAAILGVREDALRKRLERARAELSARLESMDKKNPKDSGAPR